MSSLEKKQNNYSNTVDVLVWLVNVAIDYGRPHAQQEQVWDHHRHHRRRRRRRRRTCRS